MPSAVAEILAHRARGIGADIQKRRRVRRTRGHDNGVLHRAGVLEDPHHLRDRGLLLSNRVVDADDVLALLIDDRVHRNRGLARLAVADDQLALSTADRHHRVDRLQAGLQRFLDRAAIDDAWRDAFDLHELLRDDRALAVDRLPERIHHAADELLADRHGDDAARPLDRVPFANLGVLAQQHRADAVFFEIERDAVHAMRELEHLAGHGFLDTMHPGDAVTDRHDRADLGDIDVDGVAADLVANDLGDFFRFDVHVISLLNMLSACAAVASALARLRALARLSRLARAAGAIPLPASLSSSRAVASRCRHTRCCRPARWRRR